jgi:hypothetical protein
MFFMAGIISIAPEPSTSTIRYQLSIRKFTQVPCQKMLKQPHILKGPPCRCAAKTFSITPNAHQALPGKLCKRPGI